MGTPLTANRPGSSADGKEFGFPVKTAVHIYQGGLTNLVGGYLKPAADEASATFAGFSEDECDNTLGSNGDLTCNNELRGVREVDGTFAATDVGKPAYVVSDHEVSTSATTHNVYAGLIVAILDSATALLAYDVAAIATVTSADTVVLELEAADLVGADAKVYRISSPVAGNINKITSVLEGAALAVGDATLTAAINGTGVTGGVVTITQAGSAVGDADSATPSAANTVAVGDVISVTVGGTNTAATATARVALLIGL